MEYTDDVDQPSAKENEDTASASKEEDAESSSAAKDVGSLGRRKCRDATVSTVERQLRNLSLENPALEEVRGQVDQRSELHEKRKVTEDISSTPPTAEGTRGSPLYTNRGVHIAFNIDNCDCMKVDCRGCHFPCPNCGSSKCGDECRFNRIFVLETLELDGYSEVLQDPLLQ